MRATEKKRIETLLAIYCREVYSATNKKKIKEAEEERREKAGAEKIYGRCAEKIIPNKTTHQAEIVRIVAA